MSIETWKAEFYPVPADQVPAGRPAIEHSLHKWEGTLPEALEKHDVVFRAAGGLGVYVNAHSYTGVDFGSDTCSLCHHYYHRHEEESCATCPLFLSCKHECNSERSPYTRAMEGETVPMIEALRRTLESYHDPR